MIKLSKLLLEIGDNPYKFSAPSIDDDGNIFYKFSTPEHNYSVAIQDKEDDKYELNFNTEEEMGVNTNEQVSIRVLSTVKAIALDFIEKNSPEELLFRPIKGEDKRERVYRLYINKEMHNVPDYTLIDKFNLFRLVKNK
jgi:hypothetical protein